MTVRVTGGELPQEEIDAYVARARKKYPRAEVRSLDIRVDGDDVELTYGLGPERFDRIRRITGYLVGGMESWNDAKAAEERDRVKHEAAL